MSGGRLKPLQLRILRVLSDIEPPWTLTGGAALVGVHLKHRTTRDLDLFWHDRDQLGSLPDEVRERLTADGLEVATIQRSVTFSRLNASDGAETCLVDLVAEPIAPVEEPRLTALGGVTIKIDTVHEILVNKLCALLGRSEIRDLEDVRLLLEGGADLERALEDAPRKDAGFSPLTLAWVLKSLQPRVLGRAAGLSEQELRQLELFKDSLIEKLLDLGAPETGTAP